MSDEKPRFVSDPRTPADSSWASEADWAAGNLSNLEAVGGSLSPIRRTGSLSETTIDNLEAVDGDPAGLYASDQTVGDYWAGHLGRVQRSQKHVFEGSWALKHTTNGVGAYEITSRPGDGLPIYPAVGDRFRVYWYHGHSNAVPRISFGLQIEGDTNSGYKLGVRHTHGILRLHGPWGDPVENNMSNPTVGDWHYLDMDWGMDGSLVGIAHNVTTDTRLGRVSGLDSTFSAGGIGLEHDGVHNQAGSVWFDGLQLIG